MSNPRLSLRLANAVLVLIVATAAFSTPAIAQTGGVGADGLVRVRSVYSLDETVQRIRADIAAKGIMFFQAVDQSALAAKAGITLRPSTLLEFGNPPLGAQFLTANPNAGLDWPVRLLVSQDEAGAVSRDDGQVPRSTDYIAFSRGAPAATRTSPP